MNIPPTITNTLIVVVEMRILLSPYGLRDEWADGADCSVTQTATPMEMIGLAMPGMAKPR